ncbi:cysteine hydrolase family protein [Lactiplantibacillus daowaiensis]|uniref:Cysteine hydrolase family protein n=1 Tax=Lactiplantibacillus daowaiensis TaxID=2559918 RepID=A0ABW1RYN7_9LACO|nr:isochorismatase family protein [Lactiplantibacillus daowaiensis]
MEKTALVIIDLQAGSRWLAKHLFRQAGPLDFQTLVANNQQLMTRWQAAGLPVIVVTMQPTLLSAGLQARFSRSLLQTNQLKAVTYVKKTRPSAFSNPHLLPALQAAGVQRVVVSGFTLDNGVRKTVSDAQAAGLTAVVLRDATIARSTKLFPSMVATFDNVMTTTQLLAEL